MTDILFPLHDRARERFLIPFIRKQPEVLNGSIWLSEVTLKTATTNRDHVAVSLIYNGQDLLNQNIFRSVGSIINEIDLRLYLAVAKMQKKLILISLISNIPKIDGISVNVWLTEFY